jgi:hypothetical protein
LEESRNGKRELLQSLSLVMQCMTPIQTKTIQISSIHVCSQLHSVNFDVLWKDIDWCVRF